MSRFVVGDRVLAVADGANYGEDTATRVVGRNVYDYARGDIGVVAELCSINSITIEFSNGKVIVGCATDNFSRISDEEYRLQAASIARASNMEGIPTTKGMMVGTRVVVVRDGVDAHKDLRQSNVEGNIHDYVVGDIGTIICADTPGYVNVAFDNGNIINGCISTRMAVIESNDKEHVAAVINSRTEWARRRPPN